MRASVGACMLMGRVTGKVGAGSTIEGGDDGRGREEGEFINCVTSSSGAGAGRTGGGDRGRANGGRAGSAGSTASTSRGTDLDRGGGIFSGSSRASVLALLPTGGAGHSLCWSTCRASWRARSWIRFWNLERYWGH